METTPENQTPVEPDKPKRGGDRLAFHKPDCRCNACKYKPRDGAEASLAGSAGEPATIEAQVEGALEKLESEGVPLKAQDNSARARIAQWIILKGKGMKNQEIAQQMGIQPATLSTLIRRAKKAGWLVLESPEERLEYELLPMAVDNISHFLSIRDKQVSLEVAKGAGLLKTHQALKVDGDTARTNLSLNISITGDANRKPGNVVGTPRLPVIDIEPTKVE